MGARYPDQVGVHKPCEREFGLCAHVPVWDRLFCHDGGRLPLVCLGHPGLNPKGVLVGVAGRVSWQ